MSDDAAEVDEPVESPRKYSALGKLPDSFLEGLRVSSKQWFDVPSLARSLEMSQPRFDLGDIPETFDLAPNPTFEVVERLEEQQALLIESNEHLREMVEIARADAAAARLDAEAAQAASTRAQNSTRHGIAAAWAGVAVAIILGIITLILAS
ncbi:hypothetical protein ACFP63_08710 [Oerskovia jenensis]|uniref:Uncharacterized protein n=1 Tax=Oerskovia jenensis TaxID=162169 RepID=A0ABS2LIC8_9CELL|nr:hypothetical protein [Oerskovia jenensis]MBM7480132.1 hypothetical protein [Oerskovia jenensis]